MESMVRVCPKCGYQRQPGETGQDYECPRCGVIYDKYRPAHMHQKDPEDLPQRGKLPDGGGKALPRWLKAGLPFLALLAVLLAAWGLKGLWGSRTGGDALPVTAKLSSFSYPLQGTWTGTLQEVYPEQGTVPSYTADYEATVIIGESGRVEEIRWTDVHSPLSRVTVTWQGDVVAAVGEERSGGTPEKMVEPMQECLKVQRRGNSMELNYGCPDNLELALSIPEAFAGRNSLAGTGVQQQMDDASVSILVPVCVMGENAWEVPSRGISRFVLLPLKARSTLFLSKDKEGRNILEDRDSSDYKQFTGCILPSMEVFSGGSAGMHLDFVLENVTVNTFPQDAVKTVDPESIVRLESDSIMKLNSRPYERQVQIRFTKDGTGSLEVKDRRLQPDGRPLVFALAKSS